MEMEFLIYHLHISRSYSDCYFAYDYPGNYTAQARAVDNDGNVSDPATINNIVVQ